jgi:DNA-binding response OmpR family regulator
MTISVRPARPAPLPPETIGFSLPSEGGPLVLLLEPDAEAGSRLHEALKRSGYRVREAVTTVELLGELSPALGPLDRPALVVVSVSESDGGVLDILEALEESSGLPPCIALVPKDRNDLRDQAFENGVTAVVEKPCSPQTVVAIAAEEVPAERIVAC